MQIIDFKLKTSFRVNVTPAHNFKQNLIYFQIKLVKIRNVLISIKLQQASFTKLFTTRN